MADKKVFDISHPDEAQTKPARKLMTSEPTLEQNDSATPEIQDEPTTAPIVSNKGAHLSPLSENVVPETESEPAIPGISDLPAALAEQKAEAEPEPVEAPESPMSEPADAEPEAPAESAPSELSKEEPEEEKVEPIKESASSDSILPNDSQRATAVAKDAMQSPTMFDTKAYYVPIGNSQHKHGHVLGAIIAGVVTAVVVVGGLLLFVKIS